MRIKKVVVFVILLCSASGAFGQVPDICSIAFTQGIRNNYDVLTEEDRFNLYKQRILKLTSDTYESFKASAQSFGVDVPLAEGLLGLTGNNEEKQSQFKAHYEEFRSATYNQSRYRNYFQSHTSEISSDLLSSWKSCVSLYYESWVAQKGVAASIAPFADFRQFVVTLDVKPSLLNKVKIIALEPTGQVACHYLNNRPVQPGKAMINTAAFTMTCTKDPSIAIPFVVNTDAGRSETITVPAASSKIAELTRLVEQLRSDLDMLRDDHARKIEEVRGEIMHNISLGSRTRRAVNPDGWSHFNQTSVCAENEVATGVEGGGKAGDTWIECRAIKLSR